jgi:hypothetical protein
MSIATILTRIERALATRDRRADGRHGFHDGLKIILDDFKTDLLVKADDAASGEVVQVISDIAIAVSDHRRQKFKEAKKGVTASDFIPAFGYISSLGRSRFEYRIVLDSYRERFGSQRGIFSADIVALIRDSCPWCDE